MKILSNQKGGLSTLAILGIMLAVLVLGIGGYVVVSKDSNRETPAKTATEQPAKNAVAAESLNDFSKACDGSAISNATDYGSGAVPHKIVLFQPGLSEKLYIQSSIYFQDKTWSADYKAIDAVQLVGCFKRVSEEKITNCPFKQGSVDFYSAKYDFTVYEAKTGKKIESSEVTSTSTKCPLVAAYNKTDPKIYADPDFRQVTAKVEPLVTK